VSPLVLGLWVLGRGMRAGEGEVWRRVRTARELAVPVERRERGAEAWSVDVDAGGAGGGAGDEDLSLPSGLGRATFEELARELR
jgi:hypothetical protein